MSRWFLRSQPLRPLAALLLAGGLTVVGCGKSSPPASAENQNATSGQTTQVRSTPVEPETPKKETAKALVRDDLHKSFTDAVRGPDNPPPGDAVRPPDETVTKIPTGRIFEMVRNSWDSIRFTSASGKKIQYSAQVVTNHGMMVIELYPEQAPNHVRNFIALAKAGYYDKLFFDTIRHEENPNTMIQLHSVEAGCPLGKGTTGTGSIGYWLKQEFTPKGKMAHEEGIVGACRGEEADSAATRFYILLQKAPFMEGNYTIFGKVVQGLDVLRKMGQVPVIVDDEGSRPQTPIIIEKVTIVQKEGEPRK